MLVDRMRNGSVHCETVAAEGGAKPTSITPDLVELRSHPVFDGLEDRDADRLLSSCSGLQYRAGSVIFRQGASFDGLSIVHRGLVDLAHIDGDHECGVLLLSSKDLLLPAAALYAEPSLVSARALTPTKLIRFDAEAVISVTRTSGALTSNLLKAMSGQWRMAVRNILDLNCRTAAQRVASFLLR